MTIAFFSNYLNLHQLPFCMEIMKHVGRDNFRFIATKQAIYVNGTVGRDDLNNSFDFVVKDFDGNDNHQEALRLARESDVVLIGSAPGIFLKERMRLNKLTFKYNERLLKKGDWMLLHPKFVRSIFETYIKHRKKNLYVLCASAYTKRDLSKCGFPSQKCYKWGYFPDVKNYSSFKELIELKHQNTNSSHVSLLWVARFIDLKHPEVPVQIAYKLKKNGYNFKLRMIGTGDIKTKIEKMIKDWGISDCVELLGVKDHDCVLREMEQSDILIFSSNKKEGWGAVVNEAMNAGCVVVANKVIGSVPFLIRDGINGYSYNNIEDAYIKVKSLIENPERRQKLSRKAFETIACQWNVYSATNNLMQLISSLNNNENISIIEGPCSPA